jgi:hypothetical protein
VAGGFDVKTLLVTLILCSVASAKDRSGRTYQDAIFQETHAESVRMNCNGTGYGSSMTTCHDAEMLVYTVKAGETVYMLTPYGTGPHRESLWKQPAGAAVAVWNDGKHVHVRTGAKESQYDIIGESAQDAAR